MKFGSMCLKSEAMARVTYAKLPTSFPARLSAIFSPFLTASALGMQARESVSIRRVIARKETCVKSMRSLGLSRSFAVPGEHGERSCAAQVSLGRSRRPKRGLIRLLLQASHSKPFSCVTPFV